MKKIFLVILFSVAFSVCFLPAESRDSVISFEGLGKIVRLKDETLFSVEDSSTGKITFEKKLSFSPNNGITRLIDIQDRKVVSVLSGSDFFLFDITSGVSSETVSPLNPGDCIGVHAAEGLVTSVGISGDGKYLSVWVYDPGLYTVFRLTDNLKLEKVLSLPQDRFRQYGLDSLFVSTLDGETQKSSSLAVPWRDPMKEGLGMLCLNRNEDLPDSVLFLIGWSPEGKLAVCRVWYPRQGAVKTRWIVQDMVTDEVLIQEDEILRSFDPDVFNDDRMIRDDPFGENFLHTLPLAARLRNLDIRTPSRARFSYTSLENPLYFGIEYQKDDSGLPVAYTVYAYKDSSRKQIAERSAPAGSAFNEVKIVDVLKSPLEDRVALILTESSANGDAEHPEVLFIGCHMKVGFLPYFPPGGK